MYMMWQLASLPFCCRAGEKCTVNTYLRTGISADLAKASVLLTLSGNPWCQNLRTGLLGRHPEPEMSPYLLQNST